MTDNTYIYDNSKWDDITDEFLQSVKQLNLGELIRCDQFTLLEAMSAIELMDPKIDTGMMIRESNRKILNLEQSVKAGTVKINNLELCELIGIIDETYSCLISWLEGNPLAQTVMINLYLHRPERIEDRCLRIFSQSILRLVDYIDKLAQRGCIEEEDLFINNGKFALDHQISDQKVMNALEELCQYYEKLLSDGITSKIQSNQNSKSNNSADKKPLTDEDQHVEHDKSQLQALICRLKFTYNFFGCFFNIYRSFLKGDNDLNPQTDALLSKLIKLAQCTVVKCDQHLQKCLTLIDKWNESIDFGIKPVKQHESSSEWDFPTIMGFEPLINYRSLPPAYARCPRMKSRPYAVNYLKDLIIRFRQCFSISSSFSQKSFDKSLESVEYFSKYFRPSSCVISRSLIQTLYLPNRSEKLLRDELLQSLNEYCEPLVQSIKKDEAKMAALEGFLNECSLSFLQAIAVYGYNTAGQHEKLLELIGVYKSLQYSSLAVSCIFKNTMVYSWITSHLARICIKYTLSGLELGLFSTHEYPYVFWYLYDMLYKCEREQLELSRAFIYESQNAIDNDNQKKNKSKKLRKKNQFSTSYQDNSLLSNDAYRFLTGGLFLLTYGLRLQGKIRSPVMDFTNEAICFERRFDTNAKIYQTYQSYKQTLSRLEKLEYIYREALECFSEAKELFQALGNHEDCLKVCKTNMVVAKILTSDSNSFTSRGVEFCFETHPSFPIVKV